MPYVMYSLEYDDEDKIDFSSPIPMSERPEFPYGARICLTDKEFEKMKMTPADTAEMAVGGMIHGHFMAKITSVSADATEDGEHRRVELQITDLCLESEDAENAAAKAKAEPKRGMSSLYKKSA